MSRRPAMEGLANLDVRNAIQNAGVRHWEVAEAIGISEVTFSKSLREELPLKKKIEILQAIDNIISIQEELMDCEVYYTVETENTTDEYKSKKVAMEVFNKLSGDGHHAKIVLRARKTIGETK